MKQYIETYEFLEDIVFNGEVIFEKGEQITEPRKMYSLYSSDEKDYMYLFTDKMERKSKRGGISIPLKSLKYV